MTWRGWLGALLLGLAAAAPLAMRRSAGAWVFGLYTLPMFLLIVALAASVFVATLLILRWGRRGFYAILTCGLLVLVIALPVELLGHLYAYLRPGYDVLFLKPDPELGWHIAPNMEFTWAGHEWYARNFSAKVSTNSIGFCDRDHAVQKPAGTYRIALLGDSMVEAIQVPFEKTGGQLLEAALNATAPDGRRYEVLNFGTSCYSVGQYLLTYERYVSQFRPDLVFVFTSGIQIRRNSMAQELGAFPATQGESLAVRPTFVVQEGRLVHAPAKDFNRFQEIQDRIITTEFGGERSRRKPHRCFILDHLVWPAYNILLGLQERCQSLPIANPITDEMLVVNDKILEALDENVRADGGSLVIVDACVYFDPQWQNAADHLRQFTGRRGLGYIDLSQRLIAANKEGRATCWSNDLHFNETGNEIFAHAMLEWIERRAEARPSPPITTRQPD